MRSNPALKSWYRKINKKFFDNQLTNNVCVRWVNEEDDGEATRCEEKFFGWADVANDGVHEYVIVLSKKLCEPKSTRLLTLSHEMCHIASALKDDHGPAFEQWRQYIGDRGIFKKGALVRGLTIF
jgi:hypothetical protein